MNQILYSEKTADGSNKKMIIILSILLIVIFCSIFILIKQLDDKILANVYIGDIDVGMQTKDEAKDLVSAKFDNYDGKVLKLVLDEKIIEVTAEDIGFRLENDVSQIVDNAYEYGRNDNFFVNTKNVVGSYFKDTFVEVKYTINGEKFLEVLEGFKIENENFAEDDTYEISGDKIYIHKGMNGIKIDDELAKDYVITAFLNSVETVNIPVLEIESNKVNLKNIYDEIYVAPQNASYSKGDKFELSVDKSGKEFDLADAQKQYENLNNKETLTIELKELNAQITVKDLEEELFENVLATYSSFYNEMDSDRVQNLVVAAERCNNTILYPGDEFSYNKALGTRTIANGFAPGHSFAGGKVVTTIGGGICQVSSNLYNVVLMADLEVTNRVAHGMYVEYVKPSLDATVVDGAIDFKFKNNRKYPVKIEAKVSDGTVTVSLLGLKDTDEPIIEIESVVLETLAYKTVKENDSSMKKGTTKVVQEPVEGYVSEAYRIEKDKDGNIVSRTLISKDRYIPTNEIIKVGTKEEVVVVPVEPVPTPEEPVVPQEKVEKKEDRLPPGWNVPESPYYNSH